MVLHALDWDPVCTELISCWLVLLYMGEGRVYTTATPVGTHVASIAWMLMHFGKFTKLNLSLSGGLNACFSCQPEHLCRAAGSESQVPLS